MNKFYRTASAIAFALASVGAHAAHHDFHFFDQSSKKCISKGSTIFYSACYDSEGEKGTTSTAPMVRIRIIDPVVDESARP